MCLCIYICIYIFIYIYIYIYVYVYANLSTAGRCPHDQEKKVSLEIVSNKRCQCRSAYKRIALYTYIY